MASLTENYSDATLTKANRLVKMGQVEQDPNHLETFYVKGSNTYTVRKVDIGLDEDGQPADDDGMPYVTCDCPNGLARGGRPQCYHSAAVIIMIENGTVQVPDSTGDKTEVVSLIDDEDDDESFVILDDDEYL